MWGARMKPATEGARAGQASKAALDFIASNRVDTSPALSSASVSQFRADAKVQFLPRAERAVRRHAVNVSSIEIAGVACLEVIPRNLVPGRTIVYFYGGGYVTGSAREDLIVAAALADGTNARLVAPEYRLAPEHPWPAAVDDGYAVFQALAVESGAIAVAGESAGGNLALVTLLRARRANLRMPAATVLLSPWCDLANEGDTLVANDGRDPHLGEGLCRRGCEAVCRWQAVHRSRHLPNPRPVRRGFPADADHYRHARSADEPMRAACSPHAIRRGFRGPVCLGKSLARVRVLR